MDNKYDEQLLIMQATIEANRKGSKKMKKITEYPKAIIISTIILMMDNKNISKSSPDHKDEPKYQDPTTVVPANRRAPPLDGGHYIKIVGMWTLKK